MTQLGLDFKFRRSELKMPIEVLAKRSGLSLPTVRRILRGRFDSIHFGKVQKIASVLGMPLGGVILSPSEMRLREARRKAKLLRILTQGTMGLEAQALPEHALKELEDQAIDKLLKGKGRKLWSE